MSSRARAAAKTAISLIVICVIAAAAFYAMNSFERAIFEKYRPLQFCFAVLAASVCFAYLCPKPVVTLIVCTAAAAGMWFVTPIYVGFFFPVVLQAVLCDTAEKQTKKDVYLFVAALICTIGALILWPYCKSYDDHQLSVFVIIERPTEKIIYLVFIAVLLLYYCFLAFRYRGRQKRIGSDASAKTNNQKKSIPEKKTMAITAMQLKKEKAAAKRGMAAISICAASAMSQLIYGIVFIRIEYCKAFFFSQMLFLSFLALRQSPMLWPNDPVHRFLDAALEQDD